MKFDFARTRIGAAALIAFTGGLLIAGAFNLTPFSNAQQARIGTTTPVIPEARNLADLSNSFVAVAEAVTPAVVSIRAESRVTARPPRTLGPQQQRQIPPGLPPGLEDLFPGMPDPDEQDSPTATGTGFVVSEDGYILTNNHVVTKGADRSTRQDIVHVTLNDGRVFNATIVGNDPETDVAVLKIDANKLHVAAMGDDASARIGEWVLAIGNPLGLDFTVTAGIVSAKGRRDSPNENRYRISDFIQTDAAINPGNSGGPLINIRGEVIGINSAIASQTGYYQGYGFAIPIGLARDIMNNLIANGRIRASILGVKISEVTPETAERAGLKSISGVLVGSLSDTVISPAAKAGIQEADVIVEVNGKAMDRVATLQRTIRSFSPGTTVDIKVMRWGQAKTIKVKLEERPETETVAAVNRIPDSAASALTFDKLGISVEVVTPEWLTQNRIPGKVEGLRVTEINPNRLSAAQLRGVIITDYRTASGITPIRTEADLRAALGKVKDGGVITLRVRPILRGRGGLTIDAPGSVDVRVGAQ